MKFEASLGCVRTCPKERGREDESQNIFWNSVDIIRILHNQKDVESTQEKDSQDTQVIKYKLRILNLPNAMTF